MGITFQQKLGQDSFNSYADTPEGEPVGWQAAAVTEDTKANGLDLDNNGEITTEEKTATGTLFDKYGVDTYGEYEKLTTVLDSNNDGNLSTDEYDADSLAVLDTIFNDAALEGLTTDEKLNLLQEFALSDDKNGISEEEKTKLTSFLEANQATTHGEALGDIDGVNFDFTDNQNGRTQEEDDILNGFTQSFDFQDKDGNQITDYDDLSQEQKDQVLAKITEIDEADGKSGFLSNNDFKPYRPKNENKSDGGRDEETPPPSDGNTQ